LDSTPQRLSFRSRPTASDPLRILCLKIMIWIAPSEKDTDNAALEKRLWAAADQFRANSGLKSQEYSAPVLGLIFPRNTSHSPPAANPRTLPSCSIFRRRTAASPHS
jgi:hypothetical protein